MARTPPTIQATKNKGQPLQNVLQLLSQRSLRVTARRSGPINYLGIS